MNISFEQADDLVNIFLTAYPEAKYLSFNIQNTLSDLYPNQDISKLGIVKGGYSPIPTTVHGVNYLGRVDIVLDNINDPHDFIDTLRHEVLGHFGLNTFNLEEKDAVLAAISKAKNQPGLSALWEKVEASYVGESDNIKADEVFAYHAEKLARSQYIGRPEVASIGRSSLIETCLAPTRLMCIDDLQNIACMVAQGLHDRSRSQKNFPPLENALARKYTTKSAATKKSPYEAVAERLIEQLKQGTAPWQKPWTPDNSKTSMPFNATTNLKYKGLNSIHLLSHGRSDARWMTYKQAQSIGAQVRGGESGVTCTFWIFSQERNKLDANDKPILDSDGKPIKEKVQLEYPKHKNFTVFNAEQIDGLPPLAPMTPAKWNPIERAEQILAASNATIFHNEEDNAFYRPSTDSIHLPGKGQFSDAKKYYATALHELGHWTGHESRLNRDLSHPFGSPGYAKEELRAEIASLILGIELGIGHDGGQHASYVGGWIKALEENPKEIYDAAKDADKIKNFVLSLELNIDQNVDLDNLQKTLKNMALGREVKSFEFQDGSEVWEALPNGLCELIEEHNQQPEELQKDFRATKVQNPKIQQLISQGIFAIEQCEELDLDL